MLSSKQVARVRAQADAPVRLSFLPLTRIGFYARRYRTYRDLSANCPKGIILRSILTCFPRMMTTSAAPAAVRAHVSRVPRSAWVTAVWFLSIASLRHIRRERQILQSFDRVPWRTAVCQRNETERAGVNERESRTARREISGLAALRSVPRAAYLNHRAHHRRTGHHYVTTTRSYTIIDVHHARVLRRHHRSFLCVVPIRRIRQSRLPNIVGCVLRTLRTCTRFSLRHI